MGLPISQWHPPYALDDYLRAGVELRVLVGGGGVRPSPHAHDFRAVMTDHESWVAYVDEGCVGQRAFLRSVAPIRVIVAGRQGGKTHQAAEEVVRIVLSRPGTESCLLMPNYKSTKGALRHLRRALEPVKAHWEWKEVDKCFAFSNGALLYLRTADDKTGVPTRGLTLDGVFWVDEASFVPRSAWKAAQFTQSAVKNPLAIVTTTPKGRKSWVFDLCKRAVGNPGGMVEFFRFRTFDSPYANLEFIEELREQNGRAVADEELNAIFLGDADLPFHPDDVHRAFGGEEGWRKLPFRGNQMTLGLDLGKKQDFTCLVLMNEFGESWVLEHFQAKDIGKERFWPRAMERVVDHAKRHKAIVVVDLGGGLGDFAQDHLVDELGREQVFAYNTATKAKKTKLIEGLIADFEAARILISDGDHARTLHNELLTFPRAVHEDGKVVYRGAKDGEEFDDTVLALALARHGRDNEWSGPGPSPLEGDFSVFRSVNRGAQRGKPQKPAQGGLGGFGGVRGSRHNTPFL